MLSQPTVSFQSSDGTGHRNFVQPSWMPTPPPPEVEMNCSPIMTVEVTCVLKRMRTRSAPSPFDSMGVGYVVFKKCSSLIPILVHLFNLCWSQSIIPHEWKVAAIQLISKGSAGQNPSDPGNFLHWQSLHLPHPESLVAIYAFQ